MSESCSEVVKDFNHMVSFLRKVEREMGKQLRVDEDNFIIHDEASDRIIQGNLSAAVSVFDMYQVKYENDGIAGIQEKIVDQAEKFREAADKKDIGSIMGGIVDDVIGAMSREINRQSCGVTIKPAPKAKQAPEVEPTPPEKAPEKPKTKKKK